MLYTSDGRDVEMAVPSTKAFYAQIAAGYLLAIAIAEEAAAHLASADAVHEILDALRALPDAMTRVLDAAGRDRRRRAAPRGVAPLLGGGRQRPQPHRRRRGAGQGVGALLQVDLVRRHRGQEAHRPVGRAAGARVRGRPAGVERRRRRQGDRDLPRPPGRADRDRHRRRAPLRRRARDHRGARGAPRRRVRALGDGRPPLRVRGRARHRHVGAPAARGARRGAGGRVEQPDGVGRRAAAAPRRRRSKAPAAAFLDGLRVGSYDGHLEAGTAVRIASLLATRPACSRSTCTRSSTARSARRAGSWRTSPPRSPPASRSSPVPVDAIKHQAKTVTVGISRSDEELLQVALVREVLAAGAARDALSYRALRTLVALDPAVEQVHRASPATASRATSTTDDATIHVVDRGGISVEPALAHRRRPAPRSVPSTGSPRSARSPWRVAGATAARW